MSTTTQSVPEWLVRSQDDGHFDNVVQALLKRERERYSARKASMHKTHPSMTHRITHLPTTTLKDDDIVDHYSVSVAAHPDNQPANRYMDIAPYDRTRVVVGHNGSEPSGRYLNASWVRELAGGKWWIASQAPLPQTTHAFLSVIIDPISPPPPVLSLMSPVTGSTSRVRTVVQLTRDMENGMRKAHAYIPPQVGESWMSFPEPNCSAPPLRVTLEAVEEIEEAHCIRSTVSIQPYSSTIPGEAAGEPVVFKHMLFSSWPDHSVPRAEDREALLRFVQLVDETNRDLSSQPENVRDKLDPDPPIIVGCSAGIGRTGTFIALSSLLRAYRFLRPATSLLHDSNKELPPLGPPPLGPLPEDIQEDRVAQEVDSLREQRPGMVQRNDQVALIYECLLIAFAGHAKASEK